MASSNPNSNNGNADNVGNVGNPDRRDRDPASGRADGAKESLEKEATHVLEEARMVLPGVQALFGFQLIAVYNQPFKTLLGTTEQQLHLVGILLTALTVAMLMTPAAYHRQAEPHLISRRFLRLSSYLLTAGMFSLMLSILLDCYLIAGVLLGSEALSRLLSLGLSGVFLGLWFVLPRVLRATKPAEDPSQPEA